MSCTGCGYCVCPDAPPEAETLEIEEAITTGIRPNSRMKRYKIKEKPGLTLYVHEALDGSLQCVELVDRRGNQVYLEVGDGSVLCALALEVP